MTAALQSRSVSKRKSRRMSDGYFIAIEAAVYRMDASTNFVKEHFCNCGSAKKAKQLVDLLRAGEKAKALHRAKYEEAAARQELNQSPRETIHWRRVREVLDEFKRIDAP